MKQLTVHYQELLDPLQVRSPPTIRSVSTVHSGPDVCGDQLKTIPVRNYFPETWYWDLVDVGANSKTDIDLVAPDTTTTWIATAVCTNDKFGVGVIEAPVYLEASKSGLNG